MNRPITYNITPAQTINQALISNDTIADKLNNQLDLAAVTNQAIADKLNSKSDLSAGEH